MHTAEHTIEFDTIESRHAAPADDLVVLLNEEGREIGTAAKSSVHGADTSLHLAFSCYVFNARGEVLVTRRALAKKTWPGVWTNSFCGHPAPAETLTDAVHRRADFELGLDIDRIDLALPLFRYRATDSSGIVENEVCPVYLARASADPVPNPDEVMEFTWTQPETLRRSVLASPFAFSPWMVLQMRELETFRA
ncbi:isopentenyl-diphosphate delta-isomerase [Cryobacterium sp. LW097]|uniref:isopentenyl-diphosphate Delta-isomerase n=1 Tax=unclassified Cryobacterium TaxID=2649013 RepID=UPI000B4D8078|nr:MULTISPECIES: isopentenyl-diphosphate Delta-isomerase [unclassified Cryobacterium]ASD21963.1 isopentenyl-diphosphate delta-isomerase [Cryobacterium sp. LW097]TFC53462.1 isopentenyl-diphosphate Delta-isomerase [Cryobacterium sp. TMB3-1-2]TFC59361.1 isopentenyl-diphosphate Delta-isomerase [Cryobacterium sp. TMB1-7]TFC69127.1 isopentenyl-diphosphate Delta-isomerase [Cryobacterium sp. TMB3-15]TFC76073.1 isopentenyl-diphosphate Delta-isomerase [Cryobacterium sp. TMB3-10]